MNFAFAAFAILLLANGSLFPQPKQQALFAAVFSIAHGSQFLANVPVALRGGRVGESLWPVLSGPMLFIFAIDITLTLVNSILAGLLFM